MAREIDNPYRPYDQLSESFYHKDVIKLIKKRFETHPEKKVIILQGKPSSGKTNILKRIETFPELIGEKYLPIYLDSQKYTGLDSDGLLFSIYNDIVKKLNESGYNIPPPDYIRQLRTEDDISTINSAVLAIDTKLKPDNREEQRVLCLILDEFDRLLENTDVQIISDYIKRFQLIEKEEWDNYALILSGDKKLINLTDSEIVNSFLTTAFRIDMEEILEEETIKKLITDPVKNQLTYDKNAIKRIILYSGRYFYFQQLICYYIYQYMRDKKKTHCSIEDVDQAVQRILKESRPEFVYAWENKLSTEVQLIASALADERVTEKKGNFYYIKENSLLDKIFGERISHELEELEDFGYFQKMQGRRFSEFPFKIPLYGMWVKKEFPFIRTIIQHIEIIAHTIDFEILFNEIEKTPANKLVPFDKGAILDIAKKWNALSTNIVKNRTTASFHQMESFSQSFCHRLNLEIKEKGPSPEYYFIVDIKNLKIGILEEALCFIQDRPDLSKNTISFIERRADDFAQQAQTKLTLFFYFQRTASVENLTQKSFLSLIPIDENDLKQNILSERPLENFRKIILSKLSLKRVSTYKTAGLVEATFYGRSDIINQITGTPNTSYAIVGARKIGKSSLVNKIRKNPPPGITYLHINLEYEFSDAKNYKLFFKSLQYEIERQFDIKVDLIKFPFGVNFSKLPKIIQDISQRGQKIIISLDEVDGLLALDGKYNYKLTRMFRAMSEKYHCQFIFCGFEELYHRQRDYKNPLYNFCEEIVLGPLERESALDLISIPMESIGVHYIYPENRELILGYTACHPNLIQFFCKKLIEKLEKHQDIEDRRAISIDDIKDTYDDEYKNYIIERIYMFSSLRDIEQLILMLLVEDQQEEDAFSEDEIRNKLKEQGIDISRSQLKETLKKMVMRFILRDVEKDNYKFALSVFPEILKERIDEYEYLRSKIILEIKENVSQSL